MFHVSMLHHSMPLVIWAEWTLVLSILATHSLSPFPISYLFFYSFVCCIRDCVRVRVREYVCIASVCSFSYGAGCSNILFILFMHFSVSLVPSFVRFFCKWAVVVIIVLIFRFACSSSKHQACLLALYESGRSCICTHIHNTHTDASSHKYRLYKWTKSTKREEEDRRKSQRGAEEISSLLWYFMFFGLNILFSFTFVFGLFFSKLFFYIALFPLDTHTVWSNVHRNDAFSQCLLVGIVFC